MATSSFTKNIVLSKEAARRLAREINSGHVPPTPEVSFQIMTKEELDVLVKRTENEQGGKLDKIILTIDADIIEQYEQYYFAIHPRATKKPIKHPYHESINVWMIMRRPMMNALKQRWKDFIRFFIQEQGYSNLHIEKCEISQIVYYPNKRRHDADNSVPKFILDGLVDGGLIVDDDSEHLVKLSLECRVDASHPRTELHIKILDE